MLKVKENKGITIIALVITIIVLLILAGITISQLTNSGLFNNTQIAKEEYANAQEREDDILKQYENAINTGEISSYRDNDVVSKAEYNQLASTVATLSQENANLRNTIQEMQSPSYLTSKIVTEQYTIDNNTIEPNKTIDVSTPIAKEGYTPLMMQVSLHNASSQYSGINCSSCVAYIQQIVSDNARVCVRNYHSSSNAVIKIVVSVLYIKNT